MTGQSCSHWDPFVQASGDLDDDSLKRLIDQRLVVVKDTWFWHKLQFSNRAISHDQRFMGDENDQKMMNADQEPVQASSPSLVVHFASGRLAARLTPYVLLLLLQVDK